MKILLKPRSKISNFVFWAKPKENISILLCNRGRNKFLKHVFEVGNPTCTTKIKMDFGSRTPLFPFIQIQCEKRFILWSNLTIVGFGIIKFLHSIWFTQKIRHPPYYYCFAPCKGIKENKSNVSEKLFYDKIKKMTSQKPKKISSKRQNTRNHMNSVSSANLPVEVRFRKMRSRQKAPEPKRHPPSKPKNFFSYSTRGTSRRRST